MQVILKYSVPPSDGCQTPSEGFRLQVIHKYSVLRSERCQTPSEGFRLQVKNKHLLPSRKRAAPARISACICATTLGSYFTQFPMQQLSALLQIPSGSDCPRQPV